MLYRKTIPHDGFHILRKWCQQKDGHFVFTSNVDGQFQKAGFSEDQIVECHGTLSYLQNLRGTDEIWPVPTGFTIETDAETFKVSSSLPQGPPGNNHTALFYFYCVFYF